MSGFLINTLAGFPCLFISSAVFTVVGFLFTRKFIDNIKPSIWYPLTFGILNGTIAVVIENMVQSNVPYIIMFFVPLVMVLEIMSISRNPFWIYVFLFGSFLINISVLYNLVVAVLGLVLTEISLSLSDVQYRTMVFSLTLLVSAVLELFLKKCLPTKELNFVVYRMDRSVMMVVYMYIVSMVLLVVSFVSSSVIYQVSAAGVVLRTLFFETILKDSVMLAGGYLILMFCCREAKHEFDTLALKKNLHYEKEFRGSIQKKALCSYSYNAVKERLEHDHPVFTSYMPNPCAANYYVMINHYINTIVHPDDREKLQSDLVNLDIEQKLERKMSSMQFRMNRESVLSLAVDSDDIESLKRSQNEWVWIEARDTYITDITTGDLIVYVDLFNVEEKVQEKEQLVTAATKDALTELFNRSAAEKFIQESLRDKDRVGTFFIIDMDNFKLVNDRFGHPEGDALLKKIAAALKETFRTEDVIARLGGDEFCVYAPSMNTEEIIARCMDSLLCRCQFEYSSEEGAFVVTPSVGIAMSSDAGHEYSRLYQCADEALYEAKAAGKNCWRMYSKKKS